ncbi:MAG: hypothetical protein KAI24_15660, partial [Planctomycetes bacterium]|nr:hypothetical protein [Planctomycetota bacterium]
IATGLSFTPTDMVLHSDQLVYMAGASFVFEGTCRLNIPCPALVASTPTACPAGIHAFAATLPKLGAWIRTRANGVPTNGVTLVATGTATSPPTPLSTWLPSAPGCDLLVSPTALDVVPSWAGSTEWLLYCPNASNLLGLDLYQQFVGLTFAPSGLTDVTISNRLHLTIGSL